MDAEAALGGLRPAQREAAMHGAGPMLVVAGPGTGKTRTLTARLGYLLATGQARPEELCAVTFTRKAAAEVAGRLTALLGSAAGAITVGTFHAIAQRLRPGPRPPLLDEGGRALLVQRCAAEAGVPVRRLSQALSQLQGNVTQSGAAPAAAALLQDEALARGYHAYQALKQHLGVEDLDDLLAQALRALETGAAAARPWRFLSVDEYQDVNRVQRELLRHLAGAGRDVFAIGDPDQAIYGFRGADVGNFFAFGEDFPGARVVRLSENHRSSATIVAAAAAVIGHNRQRGPAAAALRPPGERFVSVAAGSETAEAARIVAEVERLVGGTSLLAHDSRQVLAGRAVSYSFADVAVLCRTTARADLLAEALSRAGVPVQRPSRSLLETAPALALAGHLRLAAMPGVPERWNDPVLREAAALPLPERVARLAAHLGTPADVVERVLAAAAATDEPAVPHESDEINQRVERVAVLTLHGAKGLEFPVVFLAACEAEFLPGRDATAAETEEERRLFYVGLTRARDRLYLSYAQRARGTACAPSPFLNEIPAELYLGPPQAAPARKAKPQLKLF